jgi:hypothetical protein
MGLVVGPLAAVLVVLAVRYRRALRESRRIAEQAPVADATSAAAARPADCDEQLRLLLARPPGGCYVQPGGDGAGSVQVCMHSQAGCAGFALCCIVLLAAVSAGLAGYALEERVGLWRLVVVGAMLLTYLFMFFFSLIVWDATGRFRFTLTQARLTAEGRRLIPRWLTQSSLGASDLAEVRLERLQGDIGIVHAETQAGGSHTVHRDRLVRAGWLAEVISAYYAVPLVDGSQRSHPAACPAGDPHAV